MDYYWFTKIVSTNSKKHRKHVPP